MAKAKYNNRPEDEEKKRQIAAHKQAAASISSKISSGSQKTSSIPVNTAAKKVSERYGGVPVNTTKGMGSVSKGTAFNRAYGDYYASQNKKWYSGATPTGREMVARIYEVSNGDSARFNELMGEYDLARSSSGSAVYNPYTQATNYKEIEVLADAGFDVSGGITSEWLKENMWLREHARTNTGYGALAPSSKSTALNDAAWAYENLMDAEERTVAAETELASMASEAKYWADLGYSDNEIVKKLKSNNAYSTLWQMDEERLKGDAVRLNRAVNYSGDDTMYGMIWAARNGGGTGDYFTDSVKYTMGQGNRYKADPYSEAARDPSNFEGYHPYIMGSTLHSLNQKHGVTSVDQKWLDEHRYMLNDPDTAGDYRKFAEAYDLTQTAEAELAALDMWISQQMERSTMTEEDLIAKLEAAIADGAKIEYRDADDKLQSINLTTLSRMERERGYGSSLGIAYAVDFTLPRYKDKVHDMYAEKAAAEAPEAPEEAAEAPDDRVSASYSWLQRAIADITGGKFGSYGAGDAVLAAQVGAGDAETVMKYFLKEEFGIDFVGDLTESELQAVQEAIAATEVAVQTGATKEEIAAAAEAENKLFLIGESIAQQPDRHASYKDEAAYSTIRPEGVQDDLYARGMADGEFTPQAYVGGAGVPGGVAEPEENRMGEYEAMLRGSAEWDSDLFAWALEHSTNPDLVLAELRDGIAKQMRGEEGNAVSESWMRRFGGLTRNAYPTQAGSILGFKGISDSRATYGDEIYNALLANDKALQMGAISNDEYIRHIVDISTAADAVSAQLSENTRSNTFAARTINKTASEVLASGDGSLGAGVAAIEDYCNERIAGKEAENAAAEETNRALIVSGRDALTEGRDLTPEEQEAVGLVLAADTLEQQRKDKTYKNYNYILDTYAPDDTAPVDEAGSIDAAHKRGVSMLAQNTLNQDMHFAAALGMSLKEYYEAYPEQAKTAEEMLANAEAEFNTKWDAFGRSPEGLEVLNVFLETGVMPSDPPEGWENATEGGSGKLASEYDMNAADVLAMANSIWGNKLDMNLAKTMHFFRFDFPSEENSRVTLIHKYGNDPQQLRRAWDDLLVSDDRLLTDSVKSEIQARLDSATDIFAVGDPDELYGQLDIADYAEFDQYYRDIVRRNGSPLEATLVDAEVAAMDMATAVAMTAAGNLYSIPGYFTSLFSTASSELSSAYDYMRANPEADSNAVAAWTISAWVVNAAIEKWSLDKWTTPNVDTLDNAIDHARYVLGKKKLMKSLFEPGTLSTLAKGAAAYIKKAGGNALGEMAEETAQSVVSTVSGNLATQKGYILSHEDVWTASREGFMGFLLGGAASVAIDGMDTGYTDEMGNAIAAAEKLVAPEAAGTIINEALEFEATQAALTASAQQLAELENDPDNVAMKQAEEDVAVIEEELTAADAALEEATSAQQEAALALENINLEAIENDAFTEEMGKQMVEATAALDEANKAVEAATQSQQDAQTRLDEARARLEESSQKVQQKYRAIIEPAKTKAAQMIADRYYNGSTEEMKAASERYLTACAKLEEARARLHEAQASNADAVEQGREMLAVDALEAEVEAAKAELEEAYANAPESKVDAEQQEELTKAQETAQAAEEAATADPGNTRKRAAADLAQRRLEAVQAKQKMNNARGGVAARLQSSDPRTRAQAVADWQAAQKEAADTLKAAEDAEAAFNETDAQKELTEALGEARRYTTEQLLFDMEGHDEAVAAYNQLETARAGIIAEEAFRVYAEQKPGTPEYDAAKQEYDAAVEAYEDAVGRQAGSDGDVVRAIKGAHNRMYSLGSQAMDAVKNNDKNKASKAIKRILDLKLTQAQELAGYTTIAPEAGKTLTNNEIAENLASQLIDGTDNATQIEDTLNSMQSEMWGDHRTPGKTGNTGEAGQNPIEILSTLTKSIKVGYNPSSNMSKMGEPQRKAIQGMYDQYSKAIKTRTTAASDLDVGLHEFGHAVADVLPELQATEDMINALSEEVKAVYDAVDLGGEAIAEFVVAYMFSRDNAIKKAGEDFVHQFESLLKQNKKLYDAIKKASEQIALWNNASVESRIDAMVKDSTDPRRGQVGSWLRKTLRNIETAVFDLTAPADLVSKDFRQRALYSMHASRRADIALTRYLINPLGENIGKSLAERFYDAGVTEENQQEIIRFALARHALDRRAADKDVFSEAEFSTEELESIVNNAPENIVAGADALVSFWNDFMDAWWVDTGMIDQDSVDRMRKLYPHYVPTFRVMEKNFKQFGGGSSKFQMKGAVKGGSSLEVINPIASIVKMTQQMVSTVTQNDLLRAFNAEYKRGGLGEIAQDVSQEYRKQRTNTTDLEAALEMVRESGMVDPALMDDVFAEVLNLQERWYGTGQNFAPNVVSGVDEYGTPFFYKIKSGAEGLYGLLSGSSMKTQSLGAVWDGVRKFKNVFTKLTTGSNPLFAIKNMQRDIQSSVNTGTYALTYADGMVRWIGALYDVLTNAELYQEWQAMGGGSHTRYNTELSNNAAGALTKELGSALMRGTRTKGGDFKVKQTALERISNLLTWEQFNNAIENASRYVEYKYGKHDLSTPKGRMEAFMRSQDVTTNFGTHGSSLLLRYAGQIVPFMNATLQGLNKDIHLMTDLMSKDANVRRQAAPKVAKTLMNTALTAMLQYALLKMFKGKDDDEDYAILNQEMRTGNLIIPIPKALMQAMGDATGFNKPYIRIPIAQGPVARSIYAAALDITANVADYSPMEVEMGRAVWNILADSFPDGTVFQAWTDVRNNRTWYGGEIESEYERENRSGGNRFDEDTPRAVIWLAQKLGTSPAKLDYLLNQYSGFGGKIIMPLISPDNRTGKWSLGSAWQNLANSVLSAYTIDPVNTNDLSSDYSTAKSTITQIIGDYKAGLTVNNISYSVDPEQAYDAAVYLNKEFGHIDEQISAAWSEYHYIKDSDMPDGEASRRMREIIRDQIVPLEQEAIALYEEYKMQYIDNDVLAQDIAGELPWGIEHQTIE